MAEDPWPFSAQRELGKEILPCSLQLWFLIFPAQQCIWFKWHQIIALQFHFLVSGDWDDFLPFSEESFRLCGVPLWGLSWEDISHSFCQNIFPCIRKYIPMHQKIYSHTSENIFPCIRKYIPMHQKIYSHASENIFPCIIKYILMYQKIYSHASENICPCIRKYIPFHKEMN